jgi:hypothetical protein
MAIFYQGEENPSDVVVAADVFQIIRNGGTSKQILDNIKTHFQGNVSDERIQKAITELKGI